MGRTKFRHLSRASAPRMSLLRNMVTSLIKFEHIRTTYPKAKEAQWMAEKLITLAKRDTEATRRRAQGILYTPHLVMPKLFGEIRSRYLERAGGCTRVLLTETTRDDKAKMAILELVDGPRDSRFMMTAKAIAYDLSCDRSHTDITRKSVAAVTRYRKDGQSEFERMVQIFLARIQVQQQRTAAEDSKVWAQKPQGRQDTPQEQEERDDEPEDPGLWSKLSAGWRRTRR